MTANQPPAAPVDDLPAPGLRSPATDEWDARLLFRGATLIDPAAGEARSGQDLLVDHGRIEAVGRELSADGARVVDLGGRYVLPGLLSLHVHPGMMVGLRMAPDGWSAERVRHDLQVWARYGVTTVQSMGTDRDAVYEVIEAQRRHAYVGARLFTVGHGFGVPGGLPPFQMSEPGPVRLEDRAAIDALLAEQASRGARGVKLWFDDWYGQFPKMAWPVAQAIIDSSRTNGLTSYAHVYRVDDARRLMSMGLDVLAHMPRDRVMDPGLAEGMRGEGVAVIPTLTVPETNYAYVERPAWVDEPAFGRFLPPGSQAYLRDERVLDAIRARPEFPELKPDFERAMKNVAILEAGGAPFGFGTDAGVSNRVVGFAEHRELQLLVEAGVSPGRALQMATRDSAEVLGLGDELGQLEPGFRADMVVLRANPLEDIRNSLTIEAVWQDGVQLAGPLD